MKKLSEVVKITGVSRRVLQGYDSEHLVEPSAKTEGGYWLYDDEAIQKVMLVQIFREVGYERKEIKSILDSNSFNIEQELDEIINKLIEKRKRIDGMINVASSWKTAAKLPESTLRAFGRMDSANVFKYKSFKKTLDESIDNSADISEQELEELKEIAPFYYHLLAIGYLSNYKINSKCVQNCIHDLYLYLVQMFEKEEGVVLTEEEIYGEQFVNDFEKNMLNDILNDSDIVELFDVQNRENIIEFIKKAVKFFVRLVRKGYWNKS